MMRALLTKISGELLQYQQQPNIKTVCHSTLNLDHRTGNTITSVLSHKKKAPLILERTELIIREASKRFLFETFLSRSFCPSFGGEGGFLFILPSKQRKKKMQRKSSTGLRVCSLFPSSVIVILSSRAFIELEQTLFRSVDEAALLNGKLELER